MEKTKTAKRSLEVYNFSLYDKNDLQTKIDYCNVYDKDLFDILKNNITQYFENIGPEKLSQKTIKIDSEGNNPIFKSSSDRRIITGKIKIGDDDGKEIEHTTGVKKQTVVYVKEKGVYAHRPFFFMIIIPKNKKIGFIVLEKEGYFSCKKIFCQALSILIKDKMSGLLFRDENYVEDEIVKNFIEKGKYNSINISRKNLPRDLCDKYLGGYEEAGEYELELTIKAKKGADFTDVTKKKILNNMEKYDGFFNTKEFTDIGFDDTTTLKVNSTFDGTTKTIDLSETLKIRPYYTIDVVLDNKGFADFESIRNEAIGLIKGFNLGLL
jgi:hypothetical protein